MKAQHDDMVTTSTHLMQWNTVMLLCSNCLMSNVLFENSSDQRRLFRIYVVLTYLHQRHLECETVKE